MSADSETGSLSDIEVANIVASEKFDLELDLSAVAEDLEQTEWIEDTEHSRKSGNRLLIDFDKGEALGILAPSGVYVFTGANTHDEIRESKQQLFHVLAALDIVSDIEVSNSVVVDCFPDAFLQTMYSYCSY